MGLSVSHGAFQGAYSAFHRWREAICRAIGGSWPPHEEPFIRIYTETEGTPPRSDTWYWGLGYSNETHPGLLCLLCHSDCEGEISWQDCALIAKELSALVPIMENFGDGGGHIACNGGYAEVTRKFIAGCELAATNRESLEFE